MMRNRLLDSMQIRQKIRRMAFQIFEDNFEESELFLIGIEGSGYTLARHLCSEIESIASFPVHLGKISLDKFQPVQSEVQLDISLDKIENKTIILVDDVLNTGRTLAYSLKPFLKKGIKKLQTAVLVDRGHKNFPISADYVGYTLSTTLQEHISVELGEGQDLGVYLS
jgi:pyrimidine operon attenuation protein / uracil phosphoribosyltransferase